MRFRPVARAPNDLLTPEALLAERVSEVGKLAEIRFRLGAHEEALRRLPDYSSKYPSILHLTISLVNAWAPNPNNPWILSPP